MRHPDLIKQTAYQYLRKAIAHHKSDECLIWPFGRNESGYGYLVCPGDRKVEKAYRLAFKLTHGHWPTPCGLHTCDNPPCFNPRHIVEGTYGENNADRHRKGRSKGPVGSRNAAAKMNDATVLQLRIDSATMRQIDLMEKYRISRTQTVRILRGEVWKHVSMPDGMRNKYHVTKISDENIDVMIASKLPVKELAAMYGLHMITIYRRIAARKKQQLTDQK